MGIILVELDYQTFSCRL